MGYLTCCLSNGSSFGSSMQYLVIRLFTSPSNMTPIGLIKLVAMPFTHLLTPSLTANYFQFHANYAMRIFLPEIQL